MKHLKIIVIMLLLSSCSRKKPYICEFLKTTTDYQTDTPTVTVNRHSTSGSFTNKEKRDFEKNNSSYVEVKDDSTGKLKGTIEVKTTCQ